MVTPYALLEFYLNLVLVWPYELKVATEAGPFLQCIFWFGFIKKEKKNNQSVHAVWDFSAMRTKMQLSVDKQDSYYN